MRTAVACLIILTFWPIRAPAAERDEAAAAGIDCKTAYTTPAVELCASRDYHAVDPLLNEAYRAATKSIDKTNVPFEARAKWRAAPIEAQRRWIAFRDAECNLTGYEWYGGMGRAAAETTCMTELTKSRIEDLKRHANRN